MAEDERREDLDRTARLSPGELARIRRTQGGGVARISLHVQYRDGVRTAVLGPGQSLVLGRAHPSNLLIPDGSLSRQHACISVVDDEVWIEDLGSTNGTWVDGLQVERLQVEPGAAVVLGTVSLSIQRLREGELAAGGLESHERFLRVLGAELARARAFARPATLVLVRGEPERAGHLSRWLALVLRQLRDFDLAALYSDDTVELLLPETGCERARATAARVVAEAPALTLGLAVFPDHGTSPDELLEAARDALHRAAARVGEDGRGAVELAAPSRAAGPVAPREHEGGPVVRSAALARAFEMARAFAEATLPVLIRGETGTGKELVARTIHRAGPRRDEPMVCVNCGAIPATLLESTLFGHEKGAFTGADRQVRGVFEAADRGTVFLDEIGELPLQAQAALLRVLETRRFTRVGSSREVEVDVRVIAATHRDLERMSAEREFRSDLFYRLDAMALRVPPLRQRPEDLEPLVDRFLDEANAANRRAVQGLDEAALDLVHRYPWPGNVRELRNAVERAVVIARGPRITPEDLPERVRETAGRDLPDQSAARQETRPGGAPPGSDLRAELARLEADLVLRALEAVGWDRNRAAEGLGLPLRTLAHKIQNYGLKKPG